MADDPSLESRMVHLRFDGPHQRTASKRKKQPPREDVEDDRELVFAPAEGPSANEVRQKLEASDRERLLAAENEDVEPEIERQFSLRQMLVLMTVVSIGLAGTHWLPAKIYSFTCGLAALVGLGLLSLTQPVGNAAYLLWGAVMLVYIFSIIYAGTFG